MNMFLFYIELKELGWDDAINCPKDGSEFLAMEAGYMAAHKCFYQEDKWWIMQDGEVYPASPILWRPIRYEDSYK